MKLLAILLAFFNLGANAQSLYYPPNSGSEWESLSPESLGWCTDFWPELRNYLDDNNTKAFLLLKDGRLVYEEYFDSFTRDSIWYWASAGKSLTAFLVGQAQEEGLLALTDPASDYLGVGWTDLSPPQEEAIEVVHQLTMTSGLDDGVPDPYCTLDTCLQFLAEPGTRWAYHNAPYTLLDGVLEGASGQSLNVFAQSRLKTPTGMTGLFVPVDYNNVFFSTARSMARFGLLIQGGGNWNGATLLSDTAYFRAMTTPSQALNPAYGYLWWLNGQSAFMVPGFPFSIPGSLHPNAPDAMISALGKNGQIINVVPDQGLVMVRMGDAPGAGEVPVTFNDSVWVYLSQIICSASGVGSPELPAVAETILYPNPVSDACAVSWPGQVFDLQLLDVQGRVRMQQPQVRGEAVLGVADLEPGVYLVRLKAGAAMRSLRLFVQHH
ncbi:MAG: serine hydrolase [Bacteroidetes bacterium]|nr:serine hydrolase [Bacteroidota bacterium]